MLEALGVAIELGPDGVARCVDEAGIGFCFAPRYHPAMRFLGPARKELGVPTTFNFLGPLANPARRARARRSASATPTMATRMLGALRGARHRAGDGVLTATTGSTSSPPPTTSTVHELVDGEICSVRRSTRSTSASPGPIAAALAGGDAAAERRPSCACARRARRGRIRDIAVLNAAAALVVAGLVVRSRGGHRSSRGDAIDDGRAAAVLDAFIATSNAAAESGQP